MVDAAAALFAASIAVATTACGSGDPRLKEPQGWGAIQQAVVQGTVTADYPHAVALRLGFTSAGQGPAHCSGVRVGLDAILTAAHCLTESRIVDRVVVDSGGWQSGLSDPVLHPWFDEDSLAFDVGVARLTEPPDDDAYLWVAQERVGRGAVGQAVWMVGFGDTRDEDEPDPGVKRVGVGVITQVSQDNVVVAADPGMTCQGDSGGPVFIAAGGEDAGSSGPLLLGITSHGDPGCITTGVVVPVAAFQDWLSDVLEPAPRAGENRPQGPQTTATSCATRRAPRENRESQGAALLGFLAVALVRGGRGRRSKGPDAVV